MTRIDNDALLVIISSYCLFTFHVFYSKHTVEPTVRVCQDGAFVGV